MTDKVKQFSEFYEKWMDELENIVELVILMMRDQHPPEKTCEAVVNRLTAHHKEFYTYKWAAAQENVFAVCKPAWLSNLEIAHLWISGWRPSLAFRLVDLLIVGVPVASPSLAVMTEEQVKMYEHLRIKIKAEEDRVDREMERQQVGMEIMELMRLESQVRDDGDPEAVAEVDKLVEVAVKGLMNGLERVMKMADCARLKTLKGLLDVLTPNQSVEFLAVHSMLQINMRKWGKMRR